MKKILLVKILLVFLIGLFKISITYAIEFREESILSKERLKLTKEYNEKHYGINSHELKEPSIIVIHYTVSPTLKEVLELFRPAEISKGRKYISKYGDLNVGVHFIVDRDGSIYSLLPEDVTGRHTIGLNHVSIGIENVAKDASDLTPSQLKSNAELVKYLVDKYPTIEFLIGHHEYTNSDMPHYKLYRELDKAYKPTVKSDPGDEFMKKLRDSLTDEYKINLKN